ncbi:hypothetical protein [Streptomyces erythrochromogenes]|uniref:hypothetical protein n=1 Tax=Streptomyces erythrochromogenes TaxID=285574 RepID=UPI0036FDFC25
MSKKTQTFVMTFKAERKEGPTVDVHAIAEMIAEEFDGYELFVEGDEDGSSVNLDVVTVEPSGKTAHERI